MRNYFVRILLQVLRHYVNDSIIYSSKKLSGLNRKVSRNNKQNNLGIKLPVPANEEKRLKALRSYDLLDTLPEQEYDDITLLASQICGTPISLISLVDENRQWFKSKIGLDLDETPRDQAFCAYAVADESNAPLVVPDALNDKRFASNPLVTGEPNIRFYASTPLVTPDNHSIGTLCVIDRQPRDLTARQLEALQALARQVISKLELRRKSIQLQKANDNLQALVITDEMTGLHNRRGFLIHAKQQLKLFRSRQTEKWLWLIIADIDNLKQINDNFGHREGSLAIIHTASILKKTFRDADIIARLGGDEFAVLIINADESGKNIAKRLQAKFDEHNAQSGKPYNTDISFGLAPIKFGETNSVEEIMHEADKLMYKSKRRKQKAQI